MIILDFETNSANIHDVIEVAVFRIKRVEDVYIIPSEQSHSSGSVLKVECC